MDVSDLTITERLRLMTEYRLARESRKLMQLWTLLGLPVMEDSPGVTPVLLDDVGHTELEAFLADCTRQKTGAWVQSSEIFKRFIRWQASMSLPHWSQKRFSGVMARAGF